jgi:phosphoenolpyruvate synthase/pyruvate phosphate dikinase
MFHSTEARTWEKARQWQASGGERPSSIRFIRVLFRIRTATASATRQAGHKTILVRVETSPEDIHGMHAAEGRRRARHG